MSTGGSCCVSLVPVPRAPPGADAHQDPAVSPQRTRPCPWSLSRAPGGPRGHDQPQPLPGSALLLAQAVKYQGCFWVCTGAAGNGSSRSTSRLPAAAGRTQSPRAPGAVLEPHLSTMRGAPPAPDPAVSRGHGAAGTARLQGAHEPVPRTWQSPASTAALGGALGPGIPGGLGGPHRGLSWPREALLVPDVSLGCAAPGALPWCPNHCEGAPAGELQHPLGRAGAAPGGRAMQAL